MRTVEERKSGEDRADRGPTIWSPTRLARERVEFHCRDDTAGVADYGSFNASTKDGLVRVMEGSKHVGTISQGRLNLLTATHIPEDVCAALPGWIAQVEKEKAFKVVPSSQFWKGIRMALDLDCVIGCSPMVAPSSFPQALNWRGEGWGTSQPPSRSDARRRARRWDSSCAEPDCYVAPSAPGRRPGQRGG